MGLVRQICGVHEWVGKGYWATGRMGVGWVDWCRGGRNRSKSMRGFI